VTVYPIDSGDQVGSFRVIGPYPQSGFRAVDDDGTRVHIDVGNTHDWREQAIQYLRAASILDSLDHPGIAHIRGRGVLPDRRPWVASELAEGVPLCDIFARRLLTVEEAIALIRDLAEICAHAHARRVVHGEIRPHFIIMRTGEKPFPVQLGGWGDLSNGDVDGRVDVHAIGAIVYRGLTGKYPVMTPDLVAGVPGPLSALLCSMLETDLAKRCTALTALATAVRLLGDRVRSGPRLLRPRWTPAPLPDSERFADIIDLANARRDRS
jgi:serine/threonine protein kinase